MLVFVSYVGWTENWGPGGSVWGRGPEVGPEEALEEGTRVAWSRLDLMGSSRGQFIRRCYELVVFPCLLVPL